MTATEKEQQAARDKLTELAAAYTAAEEQLEAARKALNEGIVDILRERTLGPSEVTRHVPYERQHVGRIAKAAGIPPLRERTVVSAKRAPAPAARWEGSPSQPPPDPDPPDWLDLPQAVIDMTEKQAIALVHHLKTERPDWWRALGEELKGVPQGWWWRAIFYAAVNAGYAELPAGAAAEEE